MNDLKEQLTRIEAKLDRYSERTTRAEERIKGLEGYAKIGLTLVLAIAGYIAKSFLATKGL